MHSCYPIAPVAIQFAALSRLLVKTTVNVNLRLVRKLPHVFNNYRITLVYLCRLLQQVYFGIHFQLKYVDQPAEMITYF